MTLTSGRKMTSARIRGLAMRSIAITGSFLTFNRSGTFERETFAVSAIFTAPSTGTFTIGMIVRNTGAGLLNNNDFGHVSVLVFG
jgi:hypothetical protein